MTKTDAFRAHLEHCDACRTSAPFRACLDGERLLMDASDEAMTRLTRELRSPDAHLGAVERDHTDPIEYGGRREDDTRVGHHERRTPTDGEEMTVVDSREGVTE